MSSVNEKESEEPTTEESEDVGTIDETPKAQEEFNTPKSEEPTTEDSEEVGTIHETLKAQEEFNTPMTFKADERNLDGGIADREQGFDQLEKLHIEDIHNDERTENCMNKSVEVLKSHKPCVGIPGLLPRYTPEELIRLIQADLGMLDEMGGSQIPLAEDANNPNASTVESIPKTSVIEAVVRKLEELLDDMEEMLEEKPGKAEQLMVPLESVECREVSNQKVEESLENKQDVVDEVAKNNKNEVGIR